MFEFLINYNPQTLGVCQAKIPLAWKKKYRELKWNHKTKSGLNNVVIGKDLASLFPKAVSYKNNMILSESRITGGPIISGRMDSSTSELNYNNKTVVQKQQVDPYLKMLSSDSINIAPIKRCVSF